MTRAADVANFTSGIGSATSPTTIGAGFTVTNSGDVKVGGALTVTGDFTVNGTQTIINTQTLEVADKTVGIASTTPKLTNAQLDGAGINIYGLNGDKSLIWENSNNRLAFNTSIYANKYFGDGSSLTGVVSGIEVRQAGTNVGYSITAVNFASGATLTASAGVSTITIAAAGLELKQAGTSVGTAITQINFASGATLTTASAGISTITISAGLTTETSTTGGMVRLDLTAAQDHLVSAPVGFTTIIVTGGTQGESHTVRIVNAGIATVGFSTAFLFPSGSSPVLPTTSGAISLISFTVHRVGTAGTQLLAGASVNFS